MVDAILDWSTSLLFYPRLQRAPMAIGSPGSLRRIQSCIRPGHKVRALHTRGALREHPDVPALDGQVGVHVQDRNWLTWSKTDRCSQEAQRLGLKDIQISNALKNDFKRVNKIWETRFAIDYYYFFSYPPSSRIAPCVGTVGTLDAALLSSSRVEINN